MSLSAFAHYSKKKKKAKKANLIKQESSSSSLLATTNGHHTTGKKRAYFDEDVDFAAAPVKKSVAKKSTPDAKTFSVICNESPTDLPDMLIEWLISPVEPKQFFDENWEKSPCHVIRGRPNYYGDLNVTTNELDAVLRRNNLHFGRNVDIVKYDGGMRVTEEQDGRARAPLVWDAYANGYSVRILNPQTYFENVRLTLATLQEYFGAVMGANLYLTPDGSQGFAPHYDDIEAFILQLEGTKHWKLYQPPEESDILARYSSKDFNHDELGEPIYECDLHAGDMLYFPRGIVHEACTIPGTHSLHLTVSTYQTTSYADLLQVMLPHALKAAADNHIEFRRGLPIGYLNHLGLINKDKATKERVTIIRHMETLFHTMTKYLDVDGAADQLGKKFIHGSMPPQFHADQERLCSADADGLRVSHGKVQHCDDITEATRLRLSRKHALRVVNEEDKYALYFSADNALVYHGEEEQYINIEQEMTVIVSALHDNYPAYVSVEKLIENVDDKETALQFVQQLWDYSLLITSKPLANS